MEEKKLDKQPSDRFILHPRFWLMPPKRVAFFSRIFKILISERSNSFLKLKQKNAIGEKENSVWHHSKRLSYYYNLEKGGERGYQKLRK